MTISEYIKEKENMEIQILQALNVYVDLFEKITGTEVAGIQVVFLQHKETTCKLNKVSDVNILTNINRRH